MKQKVKKATTNQINISFKNSITEEKLYEFLKGKLSPGSYIKEILYREYLVEKGQLVKQTYSEQSSDDTHEDEDIDNNELEETLVDDSEWAN